MLGIARFGFYLGRWRSGGGGAAMLTSKNLIAVY
jgi:hypothetical protein